MSSRERGKAQIPPPRGQPWPEEFSSRVPYMSLGKREEVPQGQVAWENDRPWNDGERTWTETPSSLDLLGKSQGGHSSLLPRTYLNDDKDDNLPLIKCFYIYYLSRFSRQFCIPILKVRKLKHGKVTNWPTVTEPATSKPGLKLGPPSTNSWGSCCREPLEGHCRSHSGGWDWHQSGTQKTLLNG